MNSVAIILAAIKKVTTPTVSRISKICAQGKWPSPSYLGATTMLHFKRRDQLHELVAPSKFGLDHNLAQLLRRYIRQRQQRLIRVT